MGHIDDVDEYALQSEVMVRSESASEGVLANFVAHFYYRDDSDEEQAIGMITGWIGWSIAEDDLADAADAVSADSAYIGRIAADALDAVREDDPFVDDVLLIDRLQIEPEYRGRGLLAGMVDKLIETLRLGVNGCVVVTEPEPQRPGGGPYPDGAVRDRALAGLTRSLSASGFEHWPSERAMWRFAMDD